VVEFIRKAKTVLNILLGKYYTYHIGRYKHHQISFSQEGEDMLLKRIFGAKKDGFFIDVGAHHPQRFSNTYLFYLGGWKGLNIDPMPGIMASFGDTRPLDVNLELAIANNNEEQTYFQFNEPALNTFSEEVAKEKDALDGYRITSEKKIQTHKLAEVLEEYLLPEQSIDFLTVDVEGLDLDVLKSNDWGKFRPQMVLVEDLNRYSLGDFHKSKISTFMKSKNYELYAKSFNTLFFMDCTAIDFSR